MRLHVTLCLMAMMVFVQHEVTAETDPPYSGTVYIDKNWLTPSDPSIYLGKSYIGVETFEWFDFRNRQWTNSSAYSYQLSYEHGIEVIASIHTDNAQDQIDDYLDEWAFILGQAPSRLLQGLGEFQVVPAKVGEEGLKANGSTNPTHVVLYANNPKERLDEELAGEFVEEAIVHEIGHAVFYPRQENAEWTDAQTTDPCFISTYARGAPVFEDIPETLMPYLMLRLMPERVSESDKTSINQCIQARSKVLDQWLSEESFMEFPWSPWPQTKKSVETVFLELLDTILGFSGSAEDRTTPPASREPPEEQEEPESIPTFPMLGFFILRGLLGLFGILRLVHR